MKKTGSRTDLPPVEPGPTRYRSGAVARMLRMPMATLRIWERRHRVAAPATTASGHRLYSAADVQRLALVRQLTALGHPIGSIARLGIEGLREVAATHAAALSPASARASKRGRVSACTVVAVGVGARERLQRPGIQLRLERIVRVTASFARIGDVRSHPAAARHDALIVFASGLQASLLPKVLAAARHVHARRLVVVHSFAATPVADAFAAAGVSLLLEPADDVRLAGCLGSLVAAAPDRSSAKAAASVPRVLPLSTPVPAPRRYDDATLADLAGLSSTIACECPRHLAEIVMKLSHFEAYSGQCEGLDAADASLHAYLGQVSGAARSLFEAALERVAMHEGLVLP